MFTDHITIEWELIQGPTKLETGKTRDNFQWLTSLKANPINSQQTYFNERKKYTSKQTAPKLSLI